MLRAISLVSLVSLFLVGCLDVNFVTCEDGTRCPNGFACVGTGTSFACVNSASDVCRNADNGSPCAIGGLAGQCNNGLCATTCGNGTVDDGEVCDDGNVVSLDGCRADCLSDETCGNGIADLHLPSPETCDDGSDNNDEAGVCKSDCTLHCGDGEVRGTEVCDGNLALHQSCVFFGFDRGAAECGDSCGAKLDGCGFVGLVDEFATSHIASAIWQSPSGNVYVAGEGVSQRIDGRWNTVDLDLGGAILLAVGGVSDQDYCGAGFNGELINPEIRIWCFLNGVWASIPPPPGTISFGVTSAGNDVLFVTNQSGDLYKRSGGTWSSDIGVSGVNALWTRGVNDVYAATDEGGILHYGQGGWASEAVVAGPAFSAISGSASQVVAVGEQGRVSRRNQQGQWEELPRPTTGTLQSVAVGAKGEILATSGSRLWFFIDSEWLESSSALSSLPHLAGNGVDKPLVLTGRLVKRVAPSIEGLLLPPSTPRGQPVFADGKLLVGTGGRSNMLIFENGLWSETATLGVSGDKWALLAGDPVVSSTLGIRQYSSDSWKTIRPEPAQALWGIPSGPLFAADPDGSLARYDGAQWVTLRDCVDAETQCQPILALWGHESDLFAISETEILRVDDAANSVGTIETTSTPLPGRLAAISGRADDDVYVISTDGGLAHYNGTDWESLIASYSPFETLVSVAVLPDRIVATGGNSTILESTGGPWTPIRSNQAPSLTYCTADGPSLILSSIEAKRLILSSTP